MCVFNFPAELPLNCAYDLFNSYRDGTLLTHKSTNIQKAAQALGQVGAMLKDTPTFSTNILGEATLDSYIDQISEFQNADPNLMQATSINPALLALILKALELLIRKLLEN